MENAKALSLRSSRKFFVLQIVRRDQLKAACPETDKGFYDCRNATSFRRALQRNFGCLAVKRWQGLRCELL